jgi:thiosulfate/3-mercaptopyruvate sulfurtransferase
MKFVAVALLIALAVALAADMPLVQPKDLAAQLQSSGAHPALFHIGFPVLYRGKHIPGSVFAGPSSTPDGLAMLRTAVGKLSKDADIVLYCGCCPWDHCPNVKPAMDLVKQMGYTHVRVLHIPTNMAADWFDKGYPSEAGRALDPLAPPGR